MSAIIVIGAGQAATSFATKLRALGIDTPVTLIGDEPSLPYQRPPLSKKFATGDMTGDQLLLKPRAWYDDNDVDVLTGTGVRSVDRSTGTLRLDDGRQLAWDKLVFATGSRARRLPDTMTDGLSGIYALRSLADAESWGTELVKGRRALIVGGGYIGLEAAAVCATLGLDVTVVEAADGILKRVACSETSRWFHDLHEGHGVTFHEGAGLAELQGRDGRLASAVLDDGTRIEADFALVGIGVIPNASLAEEIGLAVDGGIAVDEFCRSSDQNIYAVGDCASFTYRGAPTCLESVPAAIEQANTAALHVAGAAQPYEPKPWFWSDQYDVKLQIAGFNRGYDRIVVRPGSKPNAVSHFYYDGAQLLAVDAMNEPRVYMVVKKLLEAGGTIAPDRAADMSLDLKSLL